MNSIDLEASLGARSVYDTLQQAHVYLSMNSSNQLNGKFAPFKSDLLENINYFKRGKYFVTFEKLKRNDAPRYIAIMQLLSTAKDTFHFDPKASSS
jgi:hypothetical protein